jgi:hypothetical protein
VAGAGAGGQPHHAADNVVAEQVRVGDRVPGGVLDQVVDCVAVPCGEAAGHVAGDPLVVTAVLTELILKRDQRVRSGPGSQSQTVVIEDLAFLWRSGVSRQQLWQGG